MTQFQLELDATRHSGGVNGALFSSDRVHRLRLWRVWDDRLPLLVWCLLNPSVADATENDLTLAKCIGFSKRHRDSQYAKGFGGVVIVNLFTLVSTNPDNLASRLLTSNCEDADAHILWAIERAADSCGQVAVGWGSKPWAADRARAVRRLIHDAWNGWPVLCLGTTKDGSPRHPSRLGYDTPLEEL